MAIIQQGGLKPTTEMRGMKYHKLQWASHPLHAAVQLEI